jgi:hypothetical protein
MNTRKLESAATCPDNVSGLEVLNHLVQHLPGFEPYEVRADRVALKRPSTHFDPEGFDEFRFIYRAQDHRMFGLFADLDTEWEVHSDLIKQFEAIAQKSN